MPLCKACSVLEILAAVATPSGSLRSRTLLNFIATPVLGSAYTAVALQEQLSYMGSIRASRISKTAAPSFDMQMPSLIPTIAGNACRCQAHNCVFGHQAETAAISLLCTSEVVCRALRGQVHTQRNGLSAIGILDRFAWRS